MSILHNLIPLLPTLALALAPIAAGAESTFRLAYPDTFGPLPAATYDEAGERIGGADLVIERLDSGRVRVRSESFGLRGAQTVALAELAPIGPDGSLRVLFEESRSLDAEGNDLGILSLDHVGRVARCQDPDGKTVAEIELPEHDRVVNVPMNLFFQPLVRGEKQSLEFQIFLCRPDARIIDFKAWTVRRGNDAPIEVRYGPDFGIASLLARQMAPKLSFWFDARAPYGWVAHRVPLYAGGPEVLVVRDDVASSSLTD